MKFARIELLLLIWTVPLLAVVYLYGWRKRRNILNTYAVNRTLGRIVPPGIARMRRMSAILTIFAVALTVLALSGPQYGFQWQEIERKGVDIIIALDCSRSMLANDVQPTRLDRAKREIIDLLNMLEGDRVGLVAFSGTAFLQCPLTIDYPAFYLFLDVLTPDYLPLGGSDLAAAVQTAGHAFDPQSRADKAVILITDGEHTGRQDPMAAARAAMKAGIKLFTIGVGSGDGVPVPDQQGGFKKDASHQIVLSKLDESLLSRMALATGGSYVRSVAGDIDLETIYKEQIRMHMAGATVESGRKRIWADRYQWPLALAVALLLLARWFPPVSHTGALILVLTGLLAAAAPADAGPLKDGSEAYQKGDYDKALNHFLAGQVRNPQDPSLLYNIGNTYYKLNDFQTAEAHYLQALAKAPPQLKPRLFYNLGNSAYRKGELEAAIQHYETALQLAPDDPQIRENLAFVQKQLQKQPKEGASGRNQPSDGQDDPQNSEGQQQKNDSGKPQPRQGKGPQADKAAPAAGDRAADRSQQPPVRQSDEDGGNQTDAHSTDGGAKRGADRKAASQMLNRLKDQPGRAMMPEYRKRTAEKDW